MDLTPEDIKILKYEKRAGYVFGISILALGGLLSVYLYFEENRLFFELSVLISVILCWLTVFLMNRKINKDLKAGTKFVRTERIMETRYKIDYEAGSGVLNRGKMKPYPKYTLIINGIAYNIEKELFESVKEGDTIEIHEAIFSNVLLGLKKQK